MLALWPNSLKAPTSKGAIPDDWPKDLFTFGFVRHPIDRFFSAYNMFSNGVVNVDEKGYQGTGRVAITPNIPIEHFIDKAIYEKDYEAKWSIVRHTIPMSNELNLLQHADFIGRYERFDRDLESIKAHLGLTSPTTHANMSIKRNGNWEEQFYNLSEEYQSKLVDYYKADFDIYNYEIPNMLSGS